MSDAPVCRCSDDVILCDACRRSAVDVADAIAEAVAHTRANAVNEIEYADPTNGRVSKLRRDDTGRWAIVDVRLLGSAERLRTRPAAGSA